MSHCSTPPRASVASRAEMKNTPPIKIQVVFISDFISIFNSVEKHMGSIRNQNYTVYINEIRYCKHLLNKLFKYMMTHYKFCRFSDMLSA